MYLYRFLTQLHKSEMIVKNQFLNQYLAAVLKHHVHFALVEICFLDKFDFSCLFSSLSQTQT